MNIRKSAEDYLETMLMLRDEKGFIRSIDVANSLGVTKPSVSVAVKKLAENGYLRMADDKEITLTEAGEAVAGNIYRRHKVLMAMLRHMGVPENIARNDACEMEHAISDETLRYIEACLKKNCIEF